MIKKILPLFLALLMVMPPVYSASTSVKSLKEQKSKADQNVERKNKKLKESQSEAKRSLSALNEITAEIRQQRKAISKLNGEAACAGHSECDSIIMDKAYVLASPQLSASCTDASLIHEAAIGKIAGEQLIKLMSLGLTEEEAEEQIINGFLR